MFKLGSGFWRGRYGLWLARGLFGFFIWSTCISLSSAASPSEGELRAAVIVALMRFTSWDSVAREKNLLDVCLLGKPVSAEVLLAVGSEQKVAARGLNIRPITQAIDHCQVVVIGGDVDFEDYERVIEQADGQPILTICDGCRRGFGEDAIIQLRLRQKRIIFEVNLARARSNDVVLDAQLLELAAVVWR